MSTPVPPRGQNDRRILGDYLSRNYCYGRYLPERIPLKFTGKNGKMLDFCDSGKVLPSHILVSRAVVEIHKIVPGKWSTCFDLILKVLDSLC